MLLRNKILFSFFMIILFTGVVTTWMGLRFINHNLIRQAQEHVKNDLNFAREVYRENLEKIQGVVRLTSVRIFVREGLENNDIPLMQKELKNVYINENLDILTLTDRFGQVLIRTTKTDTLGDFQKDNAVVCHVITHKEATASTEIFSKIELDRESKTLAQQAVIQIISTPRSKPGLKTQETSGMMLVAASPVFNEKDSLLGILYGGRLINKDCEIVDRAKDIIYKEMSYKGKDIGTVTIFQEDIRISTNARREDGRLAIGTRVSEDVYNHILVKGQPWIERAFVVHEWYITAYEPIRDSSGKMIGMLSVGLLEQKFKDIKNRTILVFMSITLAGLVAVLFASFLLSRHITKPVKQLVTASRRMAEGDLSQKVRFSTNDEIGELGQAFNHMARALMERDDKIRQKARQKIEESERLATIGQLAAGVAHELNNPLGGILVFSHLLLEKLEPDDPNRKQLDKIIQQTTRCKDIVKGLLDFSRQTELKMQSTDINKVIEKSLALLVNQKQFRKINIIKNILPSPPGVLADVDQIQQVFINILLNAAQAMNGDGNLNLATQISDDQNYLNISFEDQGCGISEENITHLFEPFFTTKEVGSGTGLGLSVSYGILKKHQGAIKVESEIGKGSVFIISLPLAERMPS